MKTMALHVSLGRLLRSLRLSRLSRLYERGNLDALLFAKIFESTHH